MRELKHLKHYGLVLIFILAGLSVNAQHKTLELGFFGGTSYYIGDLNPALPYNMTQFAYGGVARLNTSPRWAFRFSYTHGKVKGDDLKTNAVANRELNFVSTINDFSVVAEFNFWKYFTGSKKSFFTPYLFGGAGFFLFNPKAFDGTDLQSKGTEGQNAGFDDRTPYAKYNFSVPFGFGFKTPTSSRVITMSKYSAIFKELIINSVTFFPSFVITASLIPRFFNSFNTSTTFSRSFAILAAGISNFSAISKTR